LLLFIPLLWVLPSLEDGRRTLWFFSTDPASEFANVPIYSPHIWATAAIVFLVLTGLALLWVSMLPDLASMRDNATGWRQRWGRRLAPHWRGTPHQWNMLNHRTGTLGALYFMMLVFVHFLISVDFLMTLVPGWIDALFPVTHAANALQAGVATMLLTMFFLRKFGGYKDYITLDQMWALGKLLFALSLLWFWFWFSSFNVLWYGKKPNEQAVLELLIKGPYQPAFMAAFILNFVVPLLTMMWNPLRKSLWGPPLVWGLQTACPSLWVYSAVSVVLVLVGIPLCTRAATLLGRSDPPQVVFDEIAAFPLVFAPLVFAGVTVDWVSGVLGFLWFRLFDILKPWPVRPFEKLPTGTGIMSDDLVAGVYAALCLWGTVQLRQLTGF
ncbi:MAG: phosphatidylglycerophosphatase A, partial [Planctomycetes bacterium]|nr:phosphatidylglycerophosphatase A [Planctomycetota bacterium]